MRQRIVGIVFLWFITLYCLSQPYAKPLDFSFIRHLMNENMHDEAIHLLSDANKNSLDLASDTKDSIAFYLGNAFYETKKLNQSVNAFMQVTPSSSLYYHSRFFSAYNLFFVNQIEEGETILHSLSTVEKPLFGELRNFELAGAALLKKDYIQYNTYADKFTYSYFQLKDEQEMLGSLYNDLISFNNKSMVVAGIMSAVIPGSGKIYTGKVGEGLTALLTTAVLGGITTENYLKDGFSPKTILFGSLFSIFYIGNIYGSMVSVNIYRNEFYDTIEKRILFHLHIPLRTIFK